MTLIAPIVIMQAKSTDRREQAKGAIEGKRHSEGRPSRNTPYVWTLSREKTTFRKHSLYVLEDYRFKRRFFTEYRRLLDILNKIFGRHRE